MLLIVCQDPTVEVDKPWSTSHLQLAAFELKMANWLQKTEKNI